VTLTLSLSFSTLGNNESTITKLAAGAAVFVGNLPSKDKMDNIKIKKKLLSKQTD
jgi:hypothetical protein